MSERGWIGPAATTERVFDAYVPRLVLRHLAREPFHPVRTVDGTMLFADLSGFTKLSEKLQRRGPEGAELLVTTINGVFEALLRLAYDNGGSLIKFGGDALLIFFDGEDHAPRAAHAAFRMRERLRTAGKLEVAGVRGVLRMTVGLHSDRFHFVLAGESHLEHLVLGDGARGTVETEGLAENGQIVLSATTAAALPAASLGQAAGEAGAVLLRRSPLTADFAPAEEIPRPPTELVGRALSTAVRAHVLGGRAAPEHRRASVAFLQFKGTNAMIAEEGIDAAAAAVHELVTDVQAAADAWEVCFLDSDIDADGGKLLLTAGAPRVVGDDEERMLLALRQILDGDRRLPIRIGVNRGPVFTGEIGPYYRRSYIVMGDTTNLAARVMGKAKPGTLWATPGILERSTTGFATEALEPFAAKGKAKLVQAYEVGAARRSAAVDRGARDHLPLIGRDAEIERLRSALESLAEGRGRAVALVGEAGTGKTRLLEGVSERATGMVRVAVTCEAHTAATPYAPWQTLLPALIGAAADAGPDRVYAQVVQRCADTVPDLLPWAPLIADVLDVATEPTEPVAALAPEFRAARRHEIVLRFLGPELARPTVLVIDNAHLLDEASRGLIDALGTRLDSAPWLVLTAGRPRSNGDGPSDRIDLAPLDPADSRELAEQATEKHPLPAHVLAEAVARSGGNPQFLLDLLDAAVGGVGELPESAQAASMAVIDALPPGDRALVRRLSVFGAGFHAAQLPALGLDGRGDWEPVWERLAAVLELDSGGRVRFRRTALQEAAYAGLPFGERRALHADLAAALAREDVPDPAVLARHHLQADQPAEALPYALAAAERSLASGAPADAAQLFRSALQAALATGHRGGELARIFDGLGLALWRSGQSREADEAYRQARGHAEDNPIRRAELYYRQARLAHRDGRYTVSVRSGRAGRRGLVEVTTPDAAAWRARLISNEGADRLRQGRPEEAIKLFHAALAEAEGNTSPVAERATAHASYLLDWSLVEVGRSEQAVYSPRAQEIYARLGDLEDLGNVANNLGMFAYWEGRWDDAVRLYQEATDLSERIGDVMGVSFGEGNIGETLADQGHWAQAEAYLVRSLRARRSVGLEAGGGFTRMLLGRLYARSGRPSEGLTLLEAAATELAQDSLDLTDSLFAQCYAVEAASYGGLHERAVADSERLASIAPHRLRALLIRCRAFAAPSLDEKVALLTESLAVAHQEKCDHDAAVALDALCRLVPDAPSEWTTELDDLCRRLGIVEFPAVPAT